MTSCAISRSRSEVERRPTLRAVRAVRKFSSTMLIAVAIVISTFATASMAAEPGSLAPHFEVSGTRENAPVKLSSYHGKLVYLDFWASWCGPCKHSFPWMNQLQTRYGAQGLQVLAVNLDAKHADALDFLSATPANFVIGFDPTGAVATQYGVIGMPSSVLIDADGKVVAMHAGFNDTDKEELEKLISQNLHRTASQ